MTDDNPKAAASSALEGRENNALEIVPRKRIDLEAALRYPFSGDDWISTLLIAGVVPFIPLVGIIILIGWQSRMFDQIRRGDNTLPAIEFSTDLSTGFGVFIRMMANMLPVLVALLLILFGGVVATGAVGTVVGNVTGNEALSTTIFLVGSIFAYGAAMVLVLGANLIAPEILRRIYRGEVWVITNPKPSIVAIKNAYPAYGIALLGCLIANVLGGVGVFACYVGMILSIPYCYAVIANILGQLDQVLIENRLTN